MTRIHATCVSVAGSGVLLLGPSGAGKSDLALRLIDGGALLVADDQVELESYEGILTAAAPACLAGLLEVRGLGIVPVPSVELAEVRLVVELVARARVERLPEPRTWAADGIAVPLIRLHPFEASAPAKVRLAAAVAAATPPGFPFRFDAHGQDALPSETRS